LLFRASEDEERGAGVESRRRREEKECPKRIVVDGG
jgi:hypothetical protein